jgi:hypothetical protein
MTASSMRSQHEEDEMSRSPHQRSCIPAVLVIAALLGPLTLVSCDNPGEIPPIGRRHTADPVSKVRAGVRSSEAKGPAGIPGEPGKLGPARGRRGD